MPNYVQVAAHLTPDELEQYYRQAVDPVERSHFQIIWLLACGKRVREVAEVTGYCANWIRILVRRYNQEGPTTIGANLREKGLPNGSSRLSCNLLFGGQHRHSKPLADLTIAMRPLAQSAAKKSL